MRKVAAHRVVVDKKAVRMGVVEIVDGQVYTVRELHGEEPQTEWLPGEVSIVADEYGKARAYYQGTLLTN